jgi:hypothetical protein
MSTMSLEKKLQTSNPVNKKYQNRASPTEIGNAGAIGLEKYKKSVIKEIGIEGRSL